MYTATPPSIVVVDSPIQRHMTGLLNQSGNPIFRFEAREPIGFVHFERTYEEKAKDF